jgi:hypothetical protein
MMSKSNAINVTAVLLQEGDWWSAQCLEYDIATQARSLTALHYELQRVLTSHVAVSQELGRQPFQGLPPAPQQFWDMYTTASVRIEADEVPFRVPDPSGLPAIVPHMRVGESLASQAAL